MTLTTRMTDEELADIQIDTNLALSYLTPAGMHTDIKLNPEIAERLLQEISALKVDLENQKADLTRALAQEEENLRLKERAERERDDLKYLLEFINSRVEYGKFDSADAMVIAFRDLKNENESLKTQLQMARSDGSIKHKYRADALERELKQLKGIQTNE